MIVNFLLPDFSGSKNVVTEGQMDEIMNGWRDHPEATWREWKNLISRTVSKCLPIYWSLKPSCPAIFCLRVIVAKDYWMF